MPNVPPLRFPEFSGEWEKFALSDFTERVTRRNKGNACRLPLTISAQYGLVDQITFFNKQIASADMSNYYLMKKGEFTYNKSYSGDYPWGAVKRLDRYDEGCLSSLYICFSLKPFVNSDFITHYFETTKWYRGVSEIAGEGARNHGLLNIAIPDYFATKHYLPASSEEQQKIADLFNLLTKRIETQIRVIDKLESLIKGIVVTHFSNVSNKQVITIADLGEAYSVGNLSKEDLSNDGEPCILYGELFTTYGCVAQYIKSKTNKFKQATLSKINDLLFPASTTVDATSLIAPTSIQTSGVYVAGDLFGIHVSNKYDSQYISYLLNYVYNKELAKYAQGSTIIHLHYDDIKDAKISVPILFEQNKCSHLLSLLQKRLTAEKSLLEKHLSQKAYLLQNMFI